MERLGMMVLLAAFGVFVLEGNSLSAETESVTTEQVAEESMKGLDANQDGKISLDEYLTPHNENFKKLDTDQDGNISYEEYMARYVERFEKVDANGDGLVTSEEAWDAGWEAKKKAKERRLKRRGTR